MRQCRAGSRIAIGKTLAERLGNRIQIGLSARERRILTQPRQHGEILVAALVDAWRLERERNPDVARRFEELQRRVREAHALRHHADNGPRNGREHDSLAHDRGIGAKPAAARERR